MANTTEILCNVCNENEIKLNSEGIVNFTDDRNKGICWRCTEEGYTYCNQCEKPYNKNNSDHGDYKLKHFFEHSYIEDDSSKFCSNDCYNVEYLKSARVFWLQAIADVKFLGKYDYNYTEDERNEILRKAERTILVIDGILENYQ